MDLAERLSAKRVREGQWIARCPAHEDRDPSLSLRLLEDGRWLVHCHAGCPPGAVVGAVGLSLSDLYPKGALDHQRRPVVRRHRERAYWEYIIEIAAADVREGRKLCPDTVALVREARDWLARHTVVEAWP